MKKCVSKMRIEELMPSLTEKLSARERSLTDKRHIENAVAEKEIWPNRSSSCNSVRLS